MAWIGVDLDGTLAKYSGDYTAGEIGDPIPAMTQNTHQVTNNRHQAIKNTHQLCRGCGEALYPVEDWTREMERPPDERRWFCDAGCRGRWFEANFGWRPEVERVRTIRGVARPRCGCGALMVRYSGAGRWRCKECGSTLRKKDLPNTTVSLRSR